MTKKIIGLSVEHDYGGCYYEGDVPEISVELVGVFSSMEEAEKYQQWYLNLPYSKRGTNKYIDKFLEIEV